LAVVAGPNGAGKSTFFAAQLRSEFSVFVNADEIAAGLREMPEEKRQIVAAENAEARRNRLIDEKTSFAFVSSAEPTTGSRSSGTPKNTRSMSNSTFSARTIPS
jgi:predicted ABC-type ATPase